MNASIALPRLAPESMPDHGTVRSALRQLLDTPAFSRAPRMCRLLTYLVDMKLDGREHEINEYAIGIAVFRRDARVYDTLLDPVVRVQVGRLRNRLSAWYAMPDARPALRFLLPPGSYVPVIDQQAQPEALKVLALGPLRDLAGDADSHAFVSGIEEELGSRMFHAFGNLLQLREDRGLQGDVTAEPVQRLEGSIRVENNHVRASMRVVDTGAGRIAWLSQFDCSGELGMQLQEELAGAICERLRIYFAEEYCLPAGQY